jgi:transcriptional regulator with XRE-family HTH domain
MSERPARATREELAAAFGAALRRRRKEGGITQETLAESAEVTATYVSMMERGEHSPSLYTAFALADGVGVDIAVLLAEVREALGAQATAEAPARKTQ